MNHNYKWYVSEWWVNMFSDWLILRGEFPEQAQKIKDLGSELYELGAEGAMNDERLTKLHRLVLELPYGAIKRIGLKKNPSREEVLKTVFQLGAHLIFKLERGS